MVLKNTNHSKEFSGDMDADGDSIGEADDGGQSSSLLDDKTRCSTFLGQMECKIAARHSNTSNDSEMLHKSSSIVSPAEETLLSRSLIASNKRDQKNLVQDSDGNSSNIDEDRNLEFMKRSRNFEASNHESNDKYDSGDEKILQSNKRDESEPLSTSPDSDVEEEDVKVCDICGDAGREDLLAICSRCSDGAEHTYCMREKLDKVPEGDWLCEECKCNEVLETQKVDHIKKRGSHERSKYLGRTSSLLSDPTLKLDKDPFSERPKLRNISLNRQASSQRSGERTEPCPTTKKQALESPMGSPTTSSPNQSRIGVLSKNGSSKNWDRMGKPNNQISTGTDTTGDSSENARSPSANSPHALKGNFLKSNSFSSSNSKHNVRVSDDALQKQGNDGKDGLGKSIGKSMSFKGLGRPSPVEPRVKMLPAKCFPVQDLKGHKHGRDHTSFERKNMIKLDHSLPGHTKLPRGVDGTSTLSVTNTHDYKNVQTDVKMPNILKHAGHSDQKSSDVTMNIGEIKKLSSAGVVGSTSVNGASNAFETKFNHLSVNDGSMISSRSANGTHAANEVREDVLDTQSEKAPENLSSHSRQSLNSRTVSGSRRRLPLDASVLKTKDGLHEENKLKAAIEAAMQKKQDIFKKNKIPVKPNESPISNAQRHHGGDTVSNQVRDFMSEEAMHEGDMDLRDINSNIPGSSAKQIKLLRTDFENSPVELLVTASAIPEQESVWQGGFEIHRNGKLPDICGGFQAHLSTFASGKVLEVVGKLPQKIIFNEVPRSCAWPVQFKELGAREDNIALYFFAKDTESYTRSYKILVDYMMKHDLALKGNISGVELLVFPSNHLPQKSKCWNALYFIWGVVRGRRQRFPENKFGCLGKCEIPVTNKVVPDNDVVLAENPCLHKPIADQFSIADTGHNTVSRDEVPVISGSSLQQCTSLSNGFCQMEEQSVGNTRVISPNGTRDHEKRPRNHYTSLGEAGLESASSFLRDHCQENLGMFRKHQNSTRDLNEGKNLPSELMVDKEDNLLSGKLPMVGKQEDDTIVTSVNSQALGTESDCVNNVKFDDSVKQEKPCPDDMQKNVQTKLKDDTDQRDDINYLLKNGVKLESEGGSRAKGCVDINVSADINADSLHTPQDLHDIQSHEESIGATSLGAVAITCQKRQWVDTKDTLEDLSSHSEDMKGFDSFPGCTIYGPPRFGERLDTQMGGVSFCSHKVDTSEAGDEKPIVTNPASAGECSFLVNSHPVHNIEPGDGVLPSEVALSENEDRLLGGSPNLELALGVKKKQAREGFLRFLTGVNRKDPDRPPDIVGSSKGEDGDASASLSLSLGFPFSDNELTPRAETPSSNAEQTVSSARHEINAPLMLFRGSTGK
ncbi:hypothetical protein RND81_05G187900 [Saponaria officinalis]|uniref:PHD-type domain-containing protein n=1 Tax=Saponaria officinalis TaxID=3572 RepID=A0AAW1KZA6_SAPOF